MPTLDSKQLHKALTTGVRMMPGGQPASAYISSDSKTVLLKFISATVTYACKLPVADGSTGTIKEFSLVDPSLMASIIASKEGKVQLEVKREQLNVTAKGTHAKFMPVDYPKSLVVEDSSLWKKSGIKVDITPLHESSLSLKKLLSSIRDHVGRQELLARASWKGKSLKLLLADSLHGILIESKLNTKFDKQEIALPVSVFLSVTDIATEIYVSDEECVACSKTEYLRTSLIDGASSQITFDMYETQIQRQTGFSAVVSGGFIQNAVKSIGTISDDSSAITFQTKLEKKKATMSVDSAAGSLTETLPLADLETTKGDKDLQLLLSQTSLTDVLACLPESFRISVTKEKDLLLVEGGSKDSILIRGAMVASLV